ncbi:MAG: acyloxyacyl hydrolase [Cytophagales bacterium]
MPLFVYGQGVPFTSLFHKKPVFDEIGFTTGFGFGSNPSSLPEGTYRPIYFMGYFANHLLKSEFRNTAFAIPYFYVEPQFNLVYIQKPNGAIDQSFEFGINNGLKQNLRFSDFFQTFILIGTGPHFIAIDTEKQKKGFIFSNCVGAGMQFFVQKNISLICSFRIKHMSNLELFQPNSGINSYNFHLGFTYVL